MGKKDVNDFNCEKLNSVECVVTAQNVHPARANYQPSISIDGRINDTPFLNELKIKKGARIMLTYNIDTSDGRTNGANNKQRQ